MTFLGALALAETGAAIAAWATRATDAAAAIAVRTCLRITMRHLWNGS